MVGSHYLTTTRQYSIETATQMAGPRYSSTTRQQSIETTQKSRYSTTTRQYSVEASKMVGSRYSTTVRKYSYSIETTCQMVRPTLLHFPPDNIPHIKKNVHVRNGMKQKEERSSTQEMDGTNNIHLYKAINPALSRSLFAPFRLKGVRGRRQDKAEQKFSKQKKKT